MSEFSQLFIDNFEVDSFQNVVPAELSTIFVEADKARSRIPRGADESEWDDDDGFSGYQYRCSVRAAIDRLELSGYSLAAAEEFYERGSESVIKQLEEAIDDWPGEDADITRAVIDKDERYISFYRSVRFHDWLDLLGIIIARKLQPIYGFGNNEQVTSELARMQAVDPRLLPMLDKSDASLPDGIYDYCFPGYEVLLLYRSLLERCDPASELILDYSHLVDFVGRENYELDPPPKIVILTEGSSDARLLRESLAARFQHLVAYYSFLDFASTNMQGSVGQLLNTVRAFAAAGIAQPMVALFDNDTAGHDALRQLKSGSLPSNIKAIPLPDLPLAASYPSIGPQGKFEADLNGSACGIEMYLGENALRDERGDLRPVQWTGYVKSMKRYQGEVLDKELIQRTFLKAIAASPTSGSADQDWTGIDLIWKTVFRQFS